MAAGKPSKNPASRLWWGGGLLLVIALIIALRHAGDTEPGQSGQDDSRPQTERSVGSEDLDSAAAGGSDGPRVPSRRSRGAAGATDDDSGPRFAMVDSVLDDESLTVEQSARRLAEIAANSSLSEEERFEALAHGLNLDFTGFGTLAADPALPVAMAERYLEALLNHNQDPRQQVQGCLGLMSHSDPEIRNQAIEQLAFVIGQESMTEDPAGLRQAAAAYLAQPPPPPTPEPAIPEPATPEPATTEPATPEPATPEPADDAPASDS